MRLAAEALSVRLGRCDVIVGADAAVTAGAVTALIGPNGAGKSTLLRALAGLIPSAGTIRLDGSVAGPAALRDAVAYMPQDTSATSSLTLMEVVLLGRLRSLGMRVPGDLIDEAERALARFGLDTLAGRSLDAVSGGQRQLAYLAQALFRHPGILLLDEPTAALDLRHQLVVLETLRETATTEGIGVVLAMHDLTLAAQVADSFLCLSGGRTVASGSARTVLTPARLSELYGVEADVIQRAQASPVVVPIRATLASRTA